MEFGRSSLESIEPLEPRPRPFYTDCRVVGGPEPQTTIERSIAEAELEISDHRAAIESFHIPLSTHESRKRTMRQIDLYTPAWWVGVTYILLGSRG
jgi:hypothetical protein